MQIFRRVPNSFFTPQRAAELSDFANKSAKYINGNSAGYDYLTDVIRDDQELWDEFLQEPWVKKHNPLVDTKGSLDSLAACFAEGLDVSRVWDDFAYNRFERHQDQLRADGLLGFHFRMALPLLNDRTKYAGLLADELIDINEDQGADDIHLLMGLSARTGGRDDFIGKYFSDKPEEKGRLSEGEARLIMGDESSLDDLSEVVEKLLLRNGSSMDRYVLAARVELALPSLVYNYGFRLKHQGVDDEVVITRVSKNIEALLNPLKLSAPLQEALQRQILINLFSAFPAGLEVLQAKPEELQGVMLDPHLKTDPDAKLFAKTLKGPLFLFSAGMSAPYVDRAVQIINFLEDHGYPLDFDVAIHGELAKTAELIHLSLGSKRHSQVLDDAFAGKTDQVSLTKQLVEHILKPEVLALYSDEAVIGIVKHAVDESARGLRDGSVKTPLESKSIGKVLAARPAVSNAILEVLEAEKVLTIRLFDWCGYGSRELKLLGTRAPQKLKAALLENDLGM